MNPELIKAIEEMQAGNQDAFETIYVQSYNRIYSGLDLMVKDAVLAEDLTQETFIKILSNIGQLNDPNNYYGWANRIASNCASTYLRSSMASEVAFTTITPESSDSDMLSIEDILEGDKYYEQPEEAYEAKERERLINEILEDLPDGQRAAITMYYYNDMKIREIAEASGTNENAVKQSLYQGRKKIKEKVSELEKSGTKLYSLAPFSFFLWLLEAESTEAAATVAAASGAAAITAASAAAGAAEAALGETAGAAVLGEAAGAAAGTAGASGWLASLPVWVKAVAAAVLGAGIIAGTAAGISAIRSGNSTPEEGLPVVETTIETEAPEEIAEETTEETEKETKESPTKKSEKATEKESESTDKESEEASETAVEETSETTEEVPQTEAAVVPTEAVTEAPTPAPTAAPAPAPVPTDPYTFSNSVYTFRLPDSLRGKVTVQVGYFDYATRVAAINEFATRYNDPSLLQVLENTNGIVLEYYDLYYNGFFLCRIDYPLWDAHYSYSLQGTTVKVLDDVYYPRAQGTRISLYGPDYPTMLLLSGEKPIAYNEYGLYPDIPVTPETLRSDTMRELLYIETGDYLDLESLYKLGDRNLDEAFSKKDELTQKAQNHFFNLLSSAITVH